MTYRVQVLDRDGRLVARERIAAPNHTVARYKVGRRYPASLFVLRVQPDVR